jgi:hypothetical protein
MMTPGAQRVAAGAVEESGLAAATHLFLDGGLTVRSRLSANATSPQRGLPCITSSFGRDDG